MSDMTAFEFEQMQGDLESLFTDECVIERKADTINVATDDWGYPLETPLPALETLPCWYFPQTGREADPNTTEVVVADATVVVARSVNVSNIDRVTITKQYRILLVPQPKYRVVGMPKPHMAGLELLLQTVTTE